jgi:hypothetical protein
MRQWTKRQVLLAGGSAAVAASQPGLVPRARAEVMADLLLVLSADVSRSVDDEKFKLQREGYAAAISDRLVVRIMQAGLHGRIALSFVEWAGVGNVSTIVPWAVIGSAAEAETFAARVLTAPRMFRDRTSISTGIDYAVRMFDSAPAVADRRVIDISGDGTHNSGRDVTVARDEAVAKGITVNGIAILSAVPLPFNPSHTHPPGGLLKYFEDNVIGGQGAFALAADGFPAFGQAIRQKLIKEIAAPARHGRSTG